MAAAQETAIKELEKNGIDPEEYEALIQVRQTRSEQLSKVEKTLKEIAEGRATVGNILDSELLPIWQEQTVLRQSIAEKFNLTFQRRNPGNQLSKPPLYPMVICRIFYVHCTLTLLTSVRLVRAIGTQF